MSTVLERASTITEKGQITVPKPVRDALGVSYGGRIIFRVDENGVSVRAADSENEDPILAGFLSLLAKDMVDHPEAISAFPTALVERIATLTRPVEVDPDEEIEGPVTL
jgi:antitoxin PrlF